MFFRIPNRPARPRVCTLAELAAILGKPLPVSIFAAFSGRSRKAIYFRIEGGTLASCNLSGLLCVLVPIQNTEESTQTERSQGIRAGINEVRLKTATVRKPLILLVHPPGVEPGTF